jgi:hypothetical protein
MYVEQTGLLIRMEFTCFDDYWLPLTSEGPVAQYAAGRLIPPEHR